LPARFGIWHLHSKRVYQLVSLTKLELMSSTQP